jgi:hypothetical protein
MLRLFLGPACKLLSSQLGAAALLARLLVMLASTKLLLHSAPLNQFLKAAERHPDRFSVMNPHS